MIGGKIFSLFPKVVKGLLGGIDATPKVAAAVGKGLGRSAVSTGNSLANIPRNVNTFGEATKSTYKAARQMFGGEEANMFEYATPILTKGTTASGGKQLAAALGTGYGASAALAREGAGVAWSGMKTGAKFGWKNKIPIGTGAAVALGAGSALYTAGQIQSNKTSPANLQNQLMAIGEQYSYNRSDIAGMGPTMNFSPSTYSGPLPILPSFQKKRGYSAQALGATGDLVFAMHGSRRVQ